MNAVPVGIVPDDDPRPSDGESPGAALVAPTGRVHGVASSPPVERSARPSVTLTATAELDAPTYAAFVAAVYR